MALYENDEPEKIIYAIKDGKAVVACDFDENGAPGSELLLTKNGDFFIDNTEKAYSDFVSGDLNYSGTFFKYDQFKFKETTEEGGYTVYKYVRGEVNWEFKYSGDELKIINSYRETDGKQFTLYDNLPVNSVGDKVTGELHFDIPEGYTKIEAQN